MTVCWYSVKGDLSSERESRSGARIPEFHSQISHRSVFESRKHLALNLTENPGSTAIRAPQLSWESRLRE